MVLSVSLGGGFPARLNAAEPSTLPASAAVPAAPATHTLTESNVLALLTETLQQNYVKDRGDLELRFTQPWTAPTVPDGPLAVKILELPTVGVTPSFIVRFQLCTAAATLGTWQMAVQARVWREVWMAHSTLRRGDAVSAADIARARYDVLNVREALAEFPAGDPTLELAQPVPAGAPLLARMIKLRTVIHRGQVANALVQDGVLSVTTKVEVLDDGAPGDTIRARNLVSQRNLTGRVLDGQTILISL